MGPQIVKGQPANPGLAAQTGSAGYLSQRLYTLSQLYSYVEYFYEAN
jgi:hypothetical protein